MTKLIAIHQFGEQLLNNIDDEVIFMTGIWTNKWRWEKKKKMTAARTNMQFK